MAIKLVRPDVAGDRNAQLRLECEARALAKLSHPNIVAIHEVGEHLLVRPNLTLHACEAGAEELVS